MPNLRNAKGQIVSLDPRGTSFYIDPTSIRKIEVVLTELNMNIAAPTRFLRLAALAVRKNSMDSFAKERHPDGRPWKAMAQSTKDRRGKKKRKGRKAKKQSTTARQAKPKAAKKIRAAHRATSAKGPKLLHDEGTMYRSIRTAISLSPPAAVIGFSDEKAPWHQRPHEDERLIRDHRPTRKFLPEHWNAYLHTVCMKALREQVRRGKPGLYMR